MNDDVVVAFPSGRVDQPVCTINFFKLETGSWKKLELMRGDWICTEAMISGIFVAAIFER